MYPVPACPAARAAADLAARVHESAVTDGSQQRGNRKLVSQNSCAQIAFGDGHGMSRPEGDLLECATIFAKSNFVFRSAIQIVENCLR